MSKQTTNAILLVRPASFGFNTETAVSNAFQNKPTDTAEVLKQKVLAEFDAFVSKLRSKGVNVTVVNDTPFPEKPDAIFPNNWATFHPDGTVILYPMQATNRRAERRPEILDSLQNEFDIKNIIDLSVYEKENRFLEGTGSMVFDHVNKTAYACLSSRTDRELFLKVCEQLQYKPVYFHAHDKGIEIYHTNVMMCVAEKFAVVCLNCITDPQERRLVTKSLESTCHKIIDITIDQMNHFAGNMLALHSDTNKDILVMSQRAFDRLTADQKREIEQNSEMLPLAIPTIESMGGGSARCMIAEIFLPGKNP